MGHVDTISIIGDSNIGLMIYANDKFALIPKITSEKEEKIIKDVLKVPVYKVNIAGTSLAGVFLNGTNSDILVPEIIFDKELAELNKIGKKHDVNFHVFKSELTCIGNNTLISNNVAIINIDYSDKEMKTIKELLKLDNVIKATIADIEIVGASTVINQSKSTALVHREASQEDINLIEKTFGVKADTGSINMGSPYIKSGLVCNSNGFLVGVESGGPEILNADEVLGFLDN